ncbi:IclR family transcriptional regulator [Cryobacterium frigoriphilum]|uniref:IclR family transcriptional regulator n=1 Tax=Cryobacterium frigoriphilum TaxID=1259150 RepID=A0A4R8ZVB3_9MICO|nr:IclR family transcriptional regulator [Cryobacterium frigoriphilum]TFD47281.1 IclR family transcriptional regulator [Cryobacterium frigoriphilum]
MTTSDSLPDRDPVADSVPRPVARAGDHSAPVTPLHPVTSLAEPAPGDSTGVASIHKSLAILEIVAERGGASAREVSTSLALPLPTVYRLMQTLVRSDYLVHLRSEHRFELGYKLHRLGVSLHRQIGVPQQVRAEIAELHASARAAAYFALYRGSDVVVIYIVDSPQSPRLQPLTFGFHEAAHATAFGKIMLSGMTGEQRDQYLGVHGQARLTQATVTNRAALDQDLATISARGVAWEREEFVPGMSCAAVGVRDGAGLVVGSVVISARAHDLTGREREIELLLRESGARLSRYFRSGTVPARHPD